MSKGIAIETILYLLIGILVVGIVIYMVYTYVIGSPIGEQQCRSMAITWCTNCKNANWIGGVNAGSDLQKCGTKYFSPPSSWMSDGSCTTCDCDNPSNTAAQSFCSVFIPA
jgi:hypothetical protein